MTHCDYTALVAEYLAGGGEVTKVPTGASSWKYPVYDKKSGQLRNPKKSGQLRNPEGHRFNRFSIKSGNAEQRARQEARYKRLQAIRDTYNPGETAQEIADRLGIHRKTVLEYMKELGLRPYVRRNAGGFDPRVSDEAFTREWLSSKTKHEIAAHLGYADPSNFAARAKALGLPARPYERRAAWRAEWAEIVREWKG